jgi:hypothetical protein
MFDSIKEYLKPELIWFLVGLMQPLFKASRKVGISASGGLGPDVLEERKLPNENAF